MFAGDTAVLCELCSDDLIYVHSKGDYEDEQSYKRQKTLPSRGENLSYGHGRKFFVACTVVYATNYRGFNLAFVGF